MKAVYYFFQKAPSCVFDWVLHTPLVIFTQNFSCLIHNACSVSVLSSHISDDFNFQDFQRHASHVLRPVLTYRPMKLFYLLEVIRYYKIKKHHNNDDVIKKCHITYVTILYIYLYSILYIYIYIYIYIYLSI